MQDSNSIRGQYSRVQHSVVTLECNARVEDCNLISVRKDVMGSRVEVVSG